MFTATFRDWIFQKQIDSFFIIPSLQTKFGCVKIDKKLDLATSYGYARCQTGEDS